MSGAAVQFKVRLDVTGLSDQHVTDYCILHLKQRGYHVALIGEVWETPRQMIDRLGICYEKLSKSRRDSNAPSHKVIRGASGRLVKICSNPDFDAFCQIGSTGRKQ